MKITMFAIRHKPTGKYLPTTPHGRGFTHTTPQTATPQEPPRLLCSETAAKIALSAWLKGEWSISLSYYGPDNEPDGTIKIPKTPPADRKPEEMEIVPVVLTLS